MRTVVCFRAGGTAYAVPVENVREVRAGEHLMLLPSPRPGVVGLLPYHDNALAVLEPLGSGRDHLLLLDGGSRPFGLLVEEVTGVVTLDGEVGAPPAGQDGGLVVGVITTDTGLALLVDVAALDQRLGP